MSPQSTLLLASESGHRIHQQQPDLVAEAIHSIVDPSRWPPTAVARSGFGAGASPIAPGAIRELIAYTADDGIHTANGDGSNPTIVVPNPDGAAVGELSLDAAGETVAYAVRPVGPPPSGAQRDPKSEIWLSDIGSGRAHRITDDGAMPQLSPDGKAIAFNRHGHEYLIDAVGGTPRDLGEGGCAVWSPDGSRLAMCTNDDAVFVLRLADMQRTPVATSAGPNEPSAWSPDGSTLALSSTRDGDGEVYLVQPDGSGERRLTTAPGTQSGSPWLAEGLLVTSSLPDADASDWFLVNPETGAASAVPWLHGVPTRSRPRDPAEVRGSDALAVGRRASRRGRSRGSARSGPA